MNKEEFKKTWKHKKLGFTVYNVEFFDGWAIFSNSGIDDFMEEEKFKQVYEEVK